MIARTNEFKQEIAKLGKEIDFKIVLYENDKIITEGSDFLMTEDNLNLIVEQINSAEIRETITSQDIYNVSVVRKGNLLSTMMKEIDFEIKQDLKLGEIVDCSFGLKVGNNYEYINYGKFIVYSKEYNEDTSTYSYVAFDSMMLSMIEVDDTSIIQGVTIKKAIENICEKVGLEVNITAEDITNLPNLNKTINESAFNNIEMTYRDVLDMICQALGVSMVVNDRELYLKTPSEVIDSEIKNVEGTSIAINDAINKELDEIKLYGDTQQQTYSGKNILDATQESYTLPANTNTYQKIWNTKPYLEAGTKYYISYNIDNASTSNTRSTPRLYYNREYVQAAVSNYNLTPGRKVWEFTPTVSGNYELQYWLHTSNVDVTVSKFMISTSSDITYEQYVGGTPSPNPDYPQEVQTVSGEQVIYDIGKNLINVGETYSYTRYNLLELDYVLQAGSYTLSWANASSSSTNTSSNFVLVYEDDTLSGNITLQYSTNYINFTATKNIKAIRCYSYGNYSNSAGITATFTNLMLEKGNQATTYEEYKGQQFEINLGKNLFTTTDNFVQVVGQTTYEILGTNSLSVTSTQTNYSYRYVKFKLDNLTVGKTYYIRAKAVNTNENAAKCLYVRNLADNRTLNSNENWQDTSVMSFVPTETTVIIRFYATGNTALINTCTWSDIIVSTSSDTSYSPYKTPIELCKIGEYQDFIDGTIDNWYINKYVGKVVLNENNEWGPQSYGGNTYISGYNEHYFDNASTNTSSITVLSDYFTTVSWDNRTQNIPNSMYMNLATTRPRLEIRNSQWTSISDLQTWLSTHNTEVYYVLATPTREKITDTELNSQLNALAQAQLYNGYNNISVSGDLPIYLKIKYYTKYELESFNEEYLKDRNVTFGEKYMINSIVLSRSEDTDTIYRRDEESIELNGLHEFKIKDNLIMLYDDREDYIDEIYNQLNGLEFYINDFTSPGITYLEPLDIYNVVVGENIYKCLLLNDEIKIQQGLEENIYTEMPKETTTDYTIASKTDKEVSFIVDKQGGQINAKVSKGDVINEINLDESGASINAEKINLTGYVTVSDLAGTGTTTINGSNITTGTISANRVSGGTLTGTIISGNTITGGTITAKSGFNENDPYINVKDNRDSDMTPIETRIWGNGISVWDYSNNPNANIRTEVNGMYAELYNGVVNAYGFNNLSLEEKKKNFEKFNEALKIVNDIDIYKYNYKSESDKDKKHIGIVIGNKYKYSKDVTNKENNSIDIYSLTSLCLQAIKEQQEIIKSLQSRIEKLEGGR